MLPKHTYIWDGNMNSIVICICIDMIVMYIHRRVTAVSEILLLINIKLLRMQTNFQQTNGLN